MVGSRTKVKIVKNKVAAPFREAEFDILYGEGISREGDVLDLAVTHNIVEKSGAWYSFGGERIGQGRENTRGFLKENRDIYALCLREPSARTPLLVLCARAGGRTFPLDALRAAAFFQAPLRRSPHHVSRGLAGLGFPLLLCIAK